MVTEYKFGVIFTHSVSILMDMRNDVYNYVKLNNM